MSIDITSDLAALADPAYQAFQAKLVPTVDPARILGVRTPALRRYARSLARSHPDEARAFLENPTHDLYEEMNLHAELIGIMSRTPQEAFELLDPFLPYVDNWATCDLIRVPAFQHDLPAVLDRITAWTAATGPHGEYVVRFGVVQLMELFLGDAFDPVQLEIVARIDRGEYYINMARAWYFSCALIKQPSSTLPLFEARPPRLDAWTHNKALQKARESRRVSPEQKARLQELKIKGA
ncbi:DNA alkylation repair protein [Enorma phocaeensis]|uniref:DNA alkylation repair protein n=1 Tax=Enorma phocaeensis TaxID=1871019 RepID=UPI001EF70AAC|nr:DNA alkylation repair protein [Enorma phocaeensis]